MSTLTSHEPPYLSHSRINRYLTCPRAYQHHYVDGLRPRHPPANLVFGQAIHESLAAMFERGEDLVRTFTTIWEAVRSTTINYTGRASWSSLNMKGRALLELFMEQGAPRIRAVSAVEQRFELTVTGLALPLVGVVDLVAELDGKKTLVDFKTAGSRYNAHEVEISDQLTAYQMAEPSAEQTAFCVLVKTKEPQLIWLVSRRSGAQLAEYVEKVGVVADAIRSGQFHKRPGMWCAWCDFLPICIGDQRRAQESLIQIEAEPVSAA